MKYSAAVSVAAFLIASVNAQNMSSVGAPPADSVPNAPNSGNANAALCQSQISMCRLACSNGAIAPTVNSCDQQSLQYQCECPAGSNQTVIEGAFPAAYADCMKQYGACYAGCNAKLIESAAGGSNSSSQCSADCQQQYKCGTKDAPKPSNKKTNGSSSEDSDSAATTTSVMISSAVMMVTGSVLLALL